METTSHTPTDEQTFAQLIEGHNRIKAELGKTIIGQEDVIEEILISLMAGGLPDHRCPRLGKTLLVKSIADVFDLNFSRVHDVDITGTEVLSETDDGRQLTFVPGPVFANIILADEINRTPPKTQAALLEAMQEHQVTASGQRHPLPQPFFVLATQTPIEMEAVPFARGTAGPVHVHRGHRLSARGSGSGRGAANHRRGRRPITALFNAADVLRFNALVRKVPCAEDLARYAVRLAAASRPNQDGTPEFVNEWVSWGAGRAAQTLYSVPRRVRCCRAAAMWRLRTFRLSRRPCCATACSLITAPRPKA